MTEDQPLPAGSIVIATPNDFDALVKTLDPTTGEPSVTLRLRAAAADRVERHTGDHVGDMMGVVVDGDVVAVPVIMESIAGAEITISQGSADPAPLVDRFEGCFG